MNCRLAGIFCLYVAVAAGVSCILANACNYKAAGMILGSCPFVGFYFLILLLVVSPKNAENMSANTTDIDVDFGQFILSPDGCEDHESKMYDFRSFAIGWGSHKSREEGMCIMEAVAYIAGEPHTDHPKCACPILSEFLRSWNDWIGDGALRTKLLAPFVWRIPGTRSTADIERQRQLMALDWLLRFYLPMFLDLNPGHARHAESLRKLRMTTDEFEQAKVLAEEIWATPWDCSWEAAWDAFGVGAGKAAWHAAGGIAAEILGDDVYEDVDSVIDWAANGFGIGGLPGMSPDPTRVSRRMVHRLQDSATELLDRMIRLTEPQEQAMTVIDDNLPGGDHRLHSVLNGCPQGEGVSHSLKRLAHEVVTRD